MKFYEKFKIFKNVKAVQEVTKTEGGYETQYTDNTPETEHINVMSRQNGRMAVIDMQDIELTDVQVIERLEAEYKKAQNEIAFMDMLMNEGIDL